MAEIVDPRLSGSVVTLGHHLLEDGASILVPGAAVRTDRGSEPPSGAGANP